MGSLIGGQGAFRHYRRNGDEAASTDRIYASVGIVTMRESRAFRSLFGHCRSRTTDFEHRMDRF
jgi:hypothetical protein